jgi:glycosyltransferase involved in cell wall biosynthesis
MKILVLNDAYPPYHSGGYELRCKDVVDQLTDRGHQIRIISSKLVDQHAVTNEREDQIYRRFHTGYQSKKLAEKLILEYLDVLFLAKTIKSFRPDLIYLWHIINFTKAIFPYLSGCGIPIVYDEGASGLISAWLYHGSWYTFIESESPSIIKNGLKAMIKRGGVILSGGLLKSQFQWPKTMRVYFNSELNLRNAREKGVPVEKAQVIHSGVDLNRFSFIPRNAMKTPVLIVLPGRFEPRKGQNDAVLLLACLKKNGLETCLTLVGKNSSDIYFKELNEAIENLNLRDQVTFLPMVDSDQLIKIYQESDLCFFASHARSGFSRVPLEAMACGCLVISYGNEGSNELIQDRKTGFVVAESDIQAAAATIQELNGDHPLFGQVVKNARQMVEEKYAMERYVDRIEHFLIDTVKMSL